MCMEMNCGTTKMEVEPVSLVNLDHHPSNPRADANDSRDSHPVPTAQILIPCTTGMTPSHQLPGFYSSLFQEQHLCGSRDSLEYTGFKQGELEVEDELRMKPGLALSKVALKRSATLPVSYHHQLPFQSGAGAQGQGMPSSGGTRRGEGGNLGYGVGLNRFRTCAQLGKTTIQHSRTSDFPKPLALLPAHAQLLLHALELRELLIARCLQCRALLLNLGHLAARLGQLLL